MLINVGPTKDGRIAPIFEERLRSLGGWLKVRANRNISAIFGKIYTNLESTEITELLQLRTCIKLRECAVLQ